MGAHSNWNEPSVNVHVVFQLTNGYYVRPFPTHHRVPSQGYIIYKQTKKLKPEYHGLPGPEIGKLAKEGVNIHDIVHTPEIAYTGTTRNIFPDYSRATAQDPPIRYFNYRSQEKGNVFRGVCESFRSRIGGQGGQAFRSGWRPPVLLPTSSGGHCSRRYASYWNAFLFLTVNIDNSGQLSCLCRWYDVWSFYLLNQPGPTEGKNFDHGSNLHWRWRRQERTQQCGEGM